MNRARAIVMGASMGGLLASRILSKHFDEVILIERDVLPDHPQFRKGVSQANHAHLIYTKGFEIISEYFPETKRLLEEKNTTFIDFGRVHWMQYKRWKVTGDLNAPSAIFLRYYLDWAIVKQLRQIPNIVFMEGTHIEGLVYDKESNAITGVKVKGEEVISGDLVIDAMGKASKTFDWLREFGFDNIPVNSLEVGVKYVSRVYEYPENVEIPNIIISPDLPNNMRYTLLLNTNEGLLVTLTGIMNDHPGTDEESFLEFARGNDDTCVYEFMKRLKPHSPITSYGYPRTRRIRYDKIKLPSGFLPFSDSYTSFNPIYGQGMTIAAIEAKELDKYLSKSKKFVAKKFYKKVEPFVAFAWGLSFTDMLRVPEAQGKRTLSGKMMNWYIKHVQLASTNSKVYEAFLQAMMMNKSPSSLFNPAFIMRVLFTRLFSRARRDPDFSALYQALEAQAQSNAVTATH